MDETALQVLASPSGRTLVVRAARPSAWEPARLRRVLDQAGAPVRSVVLELQGVRTVTWELGDALLEAQDRLAAQGRALLLVNVPTPVVRSLQLMDTGRTLVLVPLERLPDPVAPDPRPVVLDAPPPAVDGV